MLFSPNRLKYQPPAGISKVPEMSEEVSRALDEVRPYLKEHGGDAELIDFKDGIVKLRLKGSCAGCPMSTMTIKWGVEQYLKKKIPSVIRVDAV